jgi:hypothetical protein
MMASQPPPPHHLLQINYPFRRVLRKDPPKPDVGPWPAHSGRICVAGLRRSNTAFVAHIDGIIHVTSFAD